MLRPLPKHFGKSGEIKVRSRQGAGTTPATRSTWVKKVHAFSRYGVGAPFACGGKPELMMLGRGK